MDSKSAELERLLSQLSDVNDSMRNALGGRNDTRAHTLTRHRDILHDYQQVPHYRVFLVMRAVTYCLDYLQPMCANGNNCNLATVIWRQQSWLLCSLIASPNLLGLPVFCSDNCILKF